MLTRFIRLAKGICRDQTGDTIIEVMIVLAVLGMAIGVSYATANRSLLDTRQAQENSQATELVQSQVEQLRTQTSNTDSHSANYIYNTNPMFCMNNDSVVQQGSLDPNNPSTLDPDSGNYAPSCVLNTLYHMSIQYSTSGDTFTVKALWDDVLGKGTDSVTNTYRLHLVSNDSTDASLCPVGYIGTPPNCTLAPSPPSPFLAVTTGCKGPPGSGWSGDACLSGDTVTVSVSGVNAGDTCTLRNDQGTGSGSWTKTLSTSGNSCSGSFSFGSLDPGGGSGTPTAYLTAYVKDSGNTYKSNWISFQSWGNTPTHLSCSWSDPTAHDGYSNWVMTINNDPCPPGTTCYAPAGYCTTYGGNSPESYADDTACLVAGAGYYVYGATWDGTDYDGKPCPPGTTQVSSLDRGPPGMSGLAVIGSGAYAAETSCKLSGGSRCD